MRQAGRYQEVLMSVTGPLSGLFIVVVEKVGREIQAIYACQWLGVDLDKAVLFSK